MENNEQNQAAPTQAQPTHLLVARDLGQGIINYLQTRPWGEVNDLIAGLANAPGVVAQPLPAAAPAPPPTTPARRSKR